MSEFAAERGSFDPSVRSHPLPHPAKDDSAVGLEGGESDDIGAADTRECGQSFDCDAGV